MREVLRVVFYSIFLRSFEFQINGVYTYQFIYRQFITFMIFHNHNIGMWISSWDGHC